MSKLVVSPPVPLQAINMVHRLSIHYSKYIYHNVVLSDHQSAIGVINIGNILRAELEWTYACHLLLQLLIEASAFAEDIMVRCQQYQFRVYSCLQARTKSVKVKDWEHDDMEAALSDRQLENWRWHTFERMILEARIVYMNCLNRWWVHVCLSKKEIRRGY